MKQTLRTYSVPAILAAAILAGIVSAQFQPPAGTSSSGTGAFSMLETHTASGSAALNFTSCIQTAYDTYQIEFNQLVPATANQDLLLQVSTDGGATYITSTTYSFNAFQIGNGTTFNNTSSVGVGYRLAHDVNNTANWSAAGFARLYNPGGAVFKQLVGESTTFSSDSNRYLNILSGFWESTTAVNAFRVQFLAGNITSGIVRCYGLAKS